MNILKKIDIDQLIKFVLQRYKKDGGFAAFPSLPSTIEDTFYAIDIIENLHRLDKDINLISLIMPEKTAKFIKEHAEEKALPIRLRYYLHKISTILGKDFTDVINFTHVNKSDFAEIYYTSELVRSPVIGEIKIPAMVLGHCTCKDVYYNVLSCPEPDSLQRKNLVDWLKKCQNYDGGFGFYPGTTSFIENCNYCLSALSLLKDRPFNMKGASRFILSCQTAMGGFSRNIKAVPFLESTWHAVNVLKAL